MTSEHGAEVVVDFEGAKREANYLANSGPDDYISKDLLNLARAHLALTAKLAEAEAKAFTAGQLWEATFKMAMDRAEAAEARAKELVKYAEHKLDCNAVASILHVAGPCTCGLSAALGAP